MYFRIFFIIVAGLVLNACSSNSLRVESAPEGSDIYWVRNGQAPLKVGKTPLLLERDKMPELFNDNIQIMVTKEGFQSESAIIPKTGVTTSGRVYFALKELAGAHNSAQIDEQFNEISKGVATVQRATAKRDYEEAERKVQVLLVKFPRVSVLYDLLGNIYYLKKDLARALDAYKRSKEFNPNNPETQRMIQKITSIQGGSRDVASEGGNP